MGWATRRDTCVILAGCLLLTGTGLTFGQEVREREVTRTEVRSTAGVRRVSEILGATVSLEHGDRVGKVEDLVLDDSGSIEYMVVACDDGYVLVPWPVATVNFADRVVRIDVTQEKWRDVPTFTRGDWPNLREGRYSERLHRVFGDVGRRDRGREGVQDRREDRRDDATERREDRREGTPDRREAIPDRRETVPDRRETIPDRRETVPDRRDNPTPIRPGNTNERPATTPRTERPAGERPSERPGQNREQPRPGTDRVNPPDR